VGSERAKLTRENSFGQHCLRVCIGRDGKQGLIVDILKWTIPFFFLSPFVNFIPEHLFFTELQEDNTRFPELMNYRL
jgi:hypothetical protein